MKKLLFGLLLALLPVSVHAAEISVMPEKDADAVVVELFTSQGCSSCPPAQEFLQQLSRRPDVLTLEYHVDYWDQLKTWTGGAWKDPFSDPQWTERQVAYNQKIMESDRAFTPEMVIDGRYQSVGSSKSQVNAHIDESRTVKRQKYKLTPKIAENGQMSVTVEGARLMENAQVLLLRTIKEATTDVKGGENKGSVMKSHNIVKEMMVIGTWSSGKQDYSFSLPRFEAGQGCAVLLQNPETLQVYAGALCLM
jgi:hypothetical protein